MEECNNENHTNKRARADSGLDSDCPASKRVRIESEVDSPDSKLVDSELNSSEGERIRYDILDILDDTDAVSDHDPEIRDLDFVIKSFEEEILNPAPAVDSGESQPELGYLLEASDDELGLPPAISPSDEQPANQFQDLVAIPSDAVGLGEILGFEDEMPSYDSFGFGIGEETDANNGDGNVEFVTLGGLFDYSEASDFSEFSWRPESLPAL